MKNGKIKYLIFFLIFVVLAAFSGWEIYSLYQPPVLKDKEKAEKPVDLAVVKEAVSVLESREEITAGKSSEEATGSGEISAGTVEVRILNGSGIAGAASELAESLGEIEGLRVVSLGNTNAAEATTIRAKSSVSAKMQAAVVNITEEVHEPAEVGQYPLNREEDILIVLGRIE